MPCLAYRARMPFDSGRVTFGRFAVGGDAPSTVDEAVLSILHEHRFREVEIGTPDEIECGFVTPEHLLDTRFTFEKIGYGAGGSRALIGVRIDTHKVPADVRRAYRVMNEQVSAAENPSGFATKGQKREATELADRQVREDLAKGMYRRSKVVPVLWEMSKSELYCGALGNTVTEQVVRLFRQAFAVELSVMSAGIAAGHLLKSHGKSRDYEDVHASKFTAPPADARHEDDTDETREDPALPRTPWIAKSIDLKDFLGNELLMWLWWKNETTDGKITTAQGDVFAAFDRTLDLECAWGMGGKVTVKSDGPTRLRESAEALRTGKWPRKAGLLLSDGAAQWELTLNGDAWTVSSAKLPDVTDAQSPRELTEARLDLAVQLAGVLDALYQTFLDRRISGAWAADREAIKTWIKSRKQGAARKTPTPTSTPQPVITMTEPPAPTKTQTPETQPA